MPNVHITKSDSFLGGNESLSLDLDSAASPVVGVALLNDTPFPPGTIRLGTVKLSASGSGDISFGGGGTKGSVGFNASGGARAGIGVYGSSEDLFADLGGANQLLSGLTLDDAGVHRYVALYWGYDLAAAAKGAMALGVGGSAKFGVSGSSEGVFAFVRAYANEPGARSAVEDVVKNWRLPRQIDDLLTLPPGSWAMAEVDGSFAATLGAQYGYNFNWIHQVGLAGLSGDVGLKIQAAVEVELGFHASGKYFVVVGRDSLDAGNQVLRVRLHKMSQRGFSFALNTSLGVTGSTGVLLPQQLDQLIAGLFGTAAPQVVSDLAILRKVVDPSAPLNKLAGDFLVDFAQKELNTVVDVKQKFQEAQARIVRFLDLWDGLGAKAAAVLWGAATKADPQFQSTISALAAANGNPAALQQIVKAQFEQVDFFRSGIGQFLETQASNGVVALLANHADLSMISVLAQKVKDVLDAKVVTNLAKFIDDRLGLDKIRTLTLDQLDDRLKEKLSDFLQKPLDNAGLTEVRQTINELLQKGDKLYAEALKALNNTYSFELNATYQKTVTNDALIDVSFDFAKNAGLGPFASGAVDGDFVKLLTVPMAGVTLNAATLTHGVKRQASVSFNMPYFSSSSAGVNEAIAKMDVKAENGGLFLFDLQASDTQTQARNNVNRWSGRFAVGMKMAALGSGVRSYGDADELGREMTVSYGFRRAVKGLRTASLLNQLQPLQQTYFPGQFNAGGKPTLFQWVTDMDKLADGVENNGTGTIGNTLIGLDVAAPGTVLAGWLNAPADEKDGAYLRMSVAVQGALRRLIPYCYFQDVSRYKGGNAAAAAVLVYASIPPVNEVVVGSGGFPVAAAHPSYYWDVFDRDLLRAMVSGNPNTGNRLVSAMANVRNLMLALDGMHGEAQFYEGSQAGRLMSAALNSTIGRADLNALLFTEAEVLKSAVGAGRAMAEFRANANEPAKALEELAEFGHQITEAFHGKLTGLFNAKDEPDLLRNFGTLVFVEASRQLVGGAVSVVPTASLDVAVMRTKSAAGAAVVFPPAGWPDAGPLDAGSLAVEQRILNV
ncbi:MAG: hypothetical protein QM767_28085 [Anaeromyxobacter sp.]